jgi:hypothetical protein
MNQPLDIWKEIFSHVSCRDIVAFIKVCKEWLSLKSLLFERFYLTNCITCKVVFIMSMQSKKSKKPKSLRWIRRNVDNEFTEKPITTRKISKYNGQKIITDRPGVYRAIPLKICSVECYLVQCIQRYNSLPGYSAEFNLRTPELIDMMENRAMFNKRRKIDKEVLYGIQNPCEPRKHRKIENYSEQSGSIVPVTM